MAKNNYSGTRFILSAHTLAQCPPDSGREAAIAGRSNTGKSSALNAIAGISRLARTSRMPGHTRLLNFFQVAENRRLVDLPGYGYARVPEKMRQHWGQLLQDYFASRQSLTGLLLIVDIRHPPKPDDMQMLEWCRSGGLPVHVLLNKTDKLPRQTAIHAERTWTGLCTDQVTVQLFSALKGHGVAEARARLDAWLG